MSTFTVETECGTTRQFDSRREAEEGKQTHEALCEECDPDSADIVPVSGDGPDAAYTGHATARVSESRSGIEDNLNEMAETRAMKRATAWASGIGILAWEEMTEYVES